MTNENETVAEDPETRICKGKSTIKDHEPSAISDVFADLYGIPGMNNPFPKPATWPH